LRSSPSSTSRARLQESGFRRLASSPLQAEFYGHQVAGEIFFQELQKAMNRPDSVETADLLEVYYLCMLLGFKRTLRWRRDLRSIMSAVQEKIRRVRGPLTALSPRGAIPPTRPPRADRPLGSQAGDCHARYFIVGHLSFSGLQVSFGFWCV